MTGYVRTLPRDLFNEGSLTKCIGRLWIALDDDRRHRASFVSEEMASFDIVQDEGDGSISIANLDFRVEGRAVRLWRGLNARGSWPLWARFADDNSADDVAVFDEDGNLSQDMMDFVGMTEDGANLRIRRLARRAIAANRIVAATNVADIEDADGAFAAIHDLANDLTISTQLDLARALGWLTKDSRMAEGIPAHGAAMFDEITHGIASIAQIADAAGLPADAPERAA